MQKNIISVLLSFFSVIFIILIGTTISYRKNVIPELENKFKKEREEINRNFGIFEKELDFALKKQSEAEEKLKVKLAEEERIALEKAQKELDKGKPDKAIGHYGHALGKAQKAVK